VHPDVVLVTCSGSTPHSTSSASTWTRASLRDLVDGDVGVVACTHVPPRLAAADRAAAGTDQHLDPVGRVDQKSSKK